MTQQRHRSRKIALQALYEIDIANHLPGQALKNHLQMSDPPLPDIPSQFVQKIIEGVTTYRHSLDQLIAYFAPEWPVNQIAVIDRNILRMTLWEMQFNDTPVKVAINEAVELAKEFGADTSPRFINGVLGAAARHKDKIQAILNASQQPSLQATPSTSQQLS